MTVLSDVEAALPEEFMTPRDIRSLAGLWSAESVRRALVQLFLVGKAERTKRVENGFSYHLYRRARLPQQRAA